MKINSEWNEAEGTFTKTGTMNTLNGRVKVVATSKCVEEDLPVMSRDIGETMAQYTFNKKALNLKLKDEKMKYKICKDFAQSIKQKKAVSEATKEYIDKLLSIMENDIETLKGTILLQDKDREIFANEIKMIEKKLDERKIDPIEKVSKEEIKNVLLLFAEDDK